MASVSKRTTQNYQRTLTQWRRGLAKRLSMLERLEDRRLLAADFTASVSDADVRFETDDQNMWQSGSGADIRKEFTWTAFDQADVFGPGPVDIRINAFDIFGTGFDTRVRSEKLELGLYGGAIINPGQIDVDYQADLSLKAVGSDGSVLSTIKKGDAFTISTAKTADTDAISMSTDFPDIEAYAGVWGDVKANGYFDLKVIGERITRPTFDIDTNGEEKFEVIRACIQRAACQTDPTNTEPIQVDIYTPLPQPLDHIDIDFAGEGIDLLEPIDSVSDFLGATVFIPNLDTSTSDSTYDPNADRIVNTKLQNLSPAVNTGETDIDALRVQFDLDALLGVPFGYNDGLGVDLGDVDLFALDAQLQGFLGVGQTFDFRPNMEVTLKFSRPTMVEKVPGSGQFESVTEKTVAVGTDVNVRHPGGDLTIEPVYSVANNTFNNDTDLRLRGNLNLRFLGYNAGGGLGTLFDAFGIARANQVGYVNCDIGTFVNFQNGCETGSETYLELLDIFNQTWSLENFNQHTGSSLSLPSSAPEVSLDVLAPISAGDHAILSGTAVDFNLGDSISSLVIDWGDGSAVQSIDLTQTLPPGLYWNAVTGDFRIGHTYDLTGAYDIKVNAKDSDQNLSSTALTQVFVSDAPPDVGLLLPGGYEPGILDVTISDSPLDSFTILVDSGDGSTFDNDNDPATPPDAFEEFFADPAPTGTQTLHLYHPYVGNGYVISVTVQDDTGLETTSNYDFVDPPPVVFDRSYSVRVGDFSSFNVLWDGGNNAYDEFGYILPELTTWSGVAKVDFGDGATPISMPGLVTNNGHGNFSVSPIGFSELIPLAYTEEAVAEFEYTVQDNAGGKSSARVQVTLFGANDAPAAENDEVTVNMGQLSRDLSTLAFRESFNVVANDTDPDGASSELRVTHARLTDWDTPERLRDEIPLIYIIDPYGPFVSVELDEVWEGLRVGETAKFTISYLMTDEENRDSYNFLYASKPDPRIATLTVNLEGINPAPLVELDTSNVAALEGQAIQVTGTVFPPTVDGFKVENKQTGAITGTVDVDESTGNWTWTYTPADGPLEEAFTVSAGVNDPDGQGTIWKEAEETIYLRAFNRPPTGIADTANVLASKTVTVNVLANDSDPAGLVNDPISITDIGEGRGNSVVTYSNGSVTYDPAGEFAYLGAGQSAKEQLVYFVSDDDGATTLTPLTINVSGENDAPTVAVDGNVHWFTPAEVAEVSGSFGDVDQFNIDSDPDMDRYDEVTITASVGDIQSAQFGGQGTWDWSYDTANGVPESVTITATDESGATSSTTFALTPSIVVDTLEGSADGSITDGDISLRDAIAAAAPGDRIVFAESIANGTIVLDGTEVAIAKSLTIDGEDKNITISADGQSRVFNIDDGDAQNLLDVSLSGLTIADGQAVLIDNLLDEVGGGIVNYERLNISNSTIRDNYASGTGGGIVSFRAGELTVTNSTISGNKAFGAGGGVIAGNATLTNTTLSGNSAGHSGAFLLWSGEQATIISSTIAGNMADDSVNGYAGGINLLGGSTLTLTNTIVADNTAPSDPDVAARPNDTVNATNSLIEDGATINGIDVANIVGVDPQLDPAGLKNNGGPTKTIALQPTSPAINAGANPQSLIYDQRGLAIDRVANPDIGSFELGVDADGVEANTEDAAPNNGDGNGDGILDSNQSHVASLPNAVTGAYVTLETPSDVSLEAVSAEGNPSPSDTPTDALFPLGFLDYEITGLEDGAATTVTILLPEDTTVDTFYKYGPTATNSSDHWYEFLYDAVTETGAQFFDDDSDGDMDRVILHFVDGGRGDDDLTENGVIVDPGAVGLDLTTIVPRIKSVSASVEPVKINEKVVDVVFEDLYASVDDNYTCIFDLGDETTVEVPAENWSCSLAYDIPGVYDVTVSVRDEDGNSVEEMLSDYIVIYDPEGGFVTGGGWIDSPAGAYLADTSLSGRATFGFVSRYKKGATVPTGNTQFQFSAGDLNFESNSYDFLVVNQGGSNAQYKGTGTINGQGEYKFKIWATDNSDNDDEDTFRIKIWLEEDGTETVIYDNGKEQALGGGKIQVHKAKK